MEEELPLATTISFFHCKHGRGSEKKLFWFKQRARGTFSSLSRPLLLLLLRLALPVLSLPRILASSSVKTPSNNKTCQ